MSRQEDKKRIEQAARDQNVVSSALRLAEDTGNGVVIKPDPENPSQLIYELGEPLENLAWSTDASANETIISAGSATNGEIYKASDPPTESGVKHKKKSVRRTPPDPNLDPFTAPPNEVVRSPQGRARARQIIATTTLENHIKSGVIVDRETMIRATEILTAPANRKQLAKQLAIAQISHRRLNGNGQNQ